MNLIVGKKSKKLMERILGKKMKNLWNLKRKGVEKQNLEKKKDEFEAECSRSEIGKRRKGMEN